MDHHVQSEEQGDIPIPIPISVPPLNTSYGHAATAAAGGGGGGGGGGSHHISHATHHPTIIPQHPHHLHNHLLIPHHPQFPHSPTAQPTTTATSTPSPLHYKKPPARYRECLKNHAASMGGNAMDGCGEFMPSGEEGTIEALTCSACGCHRNFHRKELEGEAAMDYLGFPSRMGSRKLILGPSHHHQSPRNVIPGQIIVHPHHQIVQSESDEQEDHTPGIVLWPPQTQHQQQHHHHGQQTGGGKKRYRTKFTQEQKEKMLEFAERAGWKIQKQEESVVQRFCQEVGVKRRVLKVWMHNNKHNLANKTSHGGNGQSPPSPPPYVP